jgi:hypothetical protein
MRRASVDGVARRFDRPDLLDVVEGPDFGPEQVHDHVAGVDQHPVAVRQALDPGAAVPGVLQSAQEMIGHRTDVTMRTARGDDHAVGDRALTLQVDEDDVLRFFVVEAFEDEAFQGLRPLIVLRGLARRAGLMRFKRGVAVQGLLPK